mmetsp:Transcript_15907/g.39807  ORF Transcript_15907/g.39807 Transcript_15907/m.39807 type:complete len:184 (-) Transcript_15907:175-726(-)
MAATQRVNFRRRQAVRPLVAVMAAAAAAVTLSAIRLPLAVLRGRGGPGLPSSEVVEAARAAAGSYKLRVCSQCVGRNAGGGYNPHSALMTTSSMAAKAGWPSPKIEWGGCMGACEYGPNVRLVEGEIALPVVVEGMAEEEAEYKAFLNVRTDQLAERAFGLESRKVAAAKEEEDQESRETAAA